MLLYAKGEADEAAHLFYEEVAGTRLTTIQREFAKSFFIRTSDLETALLNYARRKGIDIRFQRIESPAEAEALHPEVRFFVAGDGANSPMRTALLGPASLEKHDLQYVVELKYEEAGDSGKLSRLILSMYASSRFAVKRDDVGWFLVGDAALGVPYFRALNSGMMLGSRLAQFLAHKGQLWPEQVDKKIREYNFHRPFHVVTEFMIARSKDALIDSFGAVRELFAEQPGIHAFERPAAEAEEKEEAPTE